MTSPQVENKARSKTSGLETAKVKTSGDDVKDVEKKTSGSPEKSDNEDEEEESPSVKEGEEQGKEKTSDEEEDSLDVKKEDEKHFGNTSQLNSVEKIKLPEKEAPDKEGGKEEEKVSQSTENCAKSKADRMSNPEDSSPEDKEEKTEVAKEEEQQQGVKRRVEEEAGGTSRKVVRQSVSVSRSVLLLFFIKIYASADYHGK